MENIKAMGLMSQVAKGLLKHSSSSTAAQLGDRSKYVGLSDIGKGAECMRAAVANKAFGNQHPNSDDIGTWYDEQKYDKVTSALKKQLILQRGHWLETGIEMAFIANGAKFFSQLEIDASLDGVPIFAHLDFVLIAGASNPVIRILELKSTENIPNNLYISYETQLYGQLGFLAKYWNQSCFTIRDVTGQITHSKLSFPVLCKKVFGIDMPNLVQDVDLEGWVLCLAMSDAKAFGPYKPNDTMTRFCEKTAKSIWEKASELRNNNLDLNTIDFCKGFHPLCDYCDYANICSKFTTCELSDSSYNDILVNLEELKLQRADLAKDISIQEHQVRSFYINSGAKNDWLFTGSYRFKCSDIAGRKSLNSKALLDELRDILGEDQVEALAQKYTSQGSPSQRLYISKTKK